MAGRQPRTDTELAQLGARIDELKADLAQGMEPEAIDRIMELGSILHRHRQIAGRSGEPAAGRPRPETEAELAADLDVVEEMLRRWIGRAALRRG
ncbi:hypothetical protein [Desertibaculum subflavum]|uniref:hypothetical protein n=1 Tax=Desertibaculum subflavum TaxID=2268458 RepID=UPI000E66CA95